LGVWGDPAVTGKPVHADLRERKKTFPVLAALDAPGLAGLLESGDRPEEAAALIEAAGGRTAALTEARRDLAAAQAALAEVPLEASAVADLRALLDFLVRREL
ncbi:MAG: polyprenyl synthetase family protein, partial [Streptomyces sp.]|nr:polyprenyl synthetase family protein [Streptomyces sp.]